MALKTVAELRQDFPVFTLQNKSPAPVDLTLRNGETATFGAQATGSVKSADLVRIPNRSVFRFVVPNLNELREYDVYGEWGTVAPPTPDPQPEPPRPPGVINDGAPSRVTTYSSHRLTELLAALPLPMPVNDAQTGADVLWSSQQIVNYVTAAIADAIGEPLPVVALPLNALTINATTLVENNVVGAVIGTISGTRTDNTTSLSLTHSSVELNGTDVVARVAFDYDTMGSKSFTYTVRETQTNLSSNYRDTQFTLTIANALEVTLGELILTPASLGISNATTNGSMLGAVSGATTGSTLSIANAPAGALAINSSTGVITFAGTTPGASFSFNVVETHPDATNARSTSFDATVTGAPVLQALGLQTLEATFGTPWSSQILGLTPGSLVTAAADGATLTVSGNTVSGTFAELATLTPLVASLTTDSVPGTVLLNLPPLVAGEERTFAPNDGRFLMSASGKLVQGLSATSAGVVNGTITRTLDGAIYEVVNVTLSVTTGVGGGGDPTRWMLGATRNRVLSGFGTLDTAKTGLNFHGNRLRFGTVWATDELAFHFAGAQGQEGGNAPQETTLAGNATTINAVFLVYAGTLYPVLFDGAASYSIISGSTGKWGTVKLPVKLPANATYELLTFYSVGVGENLYGQYRIQKHRGEKVWQADTYAAVKTLADTNAPVATAYDAFYNTIGNATNSQLLTYGPDMIACKGWDGRPVILMVNDSLADRQESAASADPRGNFGFASRLFDRESDGRMALFQIGGPGAKAQNELGANSSKRYDALDELATMNGAATKRGFTHIWQQMGRNDNVSTASTWAGHVRAVNQRLHTRYPGVPIVGATITPTVSFTNRGLTLAGQTLSTLWDTTLATVNAAILAGSEGTTNAVIDLNIYRMTVERKFRPGIDHLKGTVTETAGDGTATYTALKVNFEPSLGQQYIIDYGDGTGTTLTGSTVVGVQGTGPVWTLTRQEQVATVVPAGSKVYEQPSPDGVHFNKEYNIQSVAAIPPSEKAKFAPYAGM